MKPNRTRRRRVGMVSAVALVAGSLTLVPLMASAIHPAQSVFAFDGNVIDATPAVDPLYDWSDVFNQGSDPDLPPEETALPPGAISRDFTRDFLTTGADIPGSNLGYSNGDGTYFATGSKDTLDIPGWQCKKSQNATDKGDFANAYGIAAEVSGQKVFYFGLEKDDDNGTNNIGVWLLQDGEVGCVSTGGAVTFAGAHTNGDLLAVVEYDSGGNVGTARGYEWENGALNQTPKFEVTQAKCNDAAQTNDSLFCIITNADGVKDTPWWSPQKGNKTPTAELQKNVFVEGFLDITNVYEVLDKPVPCFAGMLADTRASTSLTAALYDYVGIQAPTCGPLVIKKYLDKDADGTEDLDDPTTEADEADPPGEGWTIKVFADGDGPTGTPQFEGQTDSDGKVSFADVPFGDYDAYETLKDGNWYNTDPGGTTLKKDVPKGVGTDEAKFGNACYVDKTFRVTGVPSGAALQANYTINPGTPGEVTGSVTLDATETAVSGVFDASGTLTNTLKPTDRVTWNFAYQSAPTVTVPGATNESLLDYTFSPDGNCTKTNTVAFPYSTLNGMKYKDVDADGTTTTGDPGIGGFEFKLYAGDGGAVGSALQTVNSAPNPDPQTTPLEGSYRFTNVAPGTYSIVESARSGWRQTLPLTGAGAPTFRVVTVSLGDASATVDRFSNTPLTDVRISVTPQTGATESIINCFKTSVTGTRIGSEDNTYSGSKDVAKTRDANGLDVGTYVCSVVIRDP